ncbi:unnamed protein product [Medioppia subpectinata]|uniref:Uncharacterized protein n=1 Tax=Medioppia subpectinata TaxID=1979941 RepID=A0A7R9QB88_9ACAR|nr:unnamed protein product [Medioppia subpectinata]CAG2117801.1 unnamed protein product [Medioppia subpectinata]
MKDCFYILRIVIHSYFSVRSDAVVFYL